MRERNDDLLDALLVSDLLGLTVEVDNGDTRLVVEDLDLLHGSGGTLRLGSQGLEHGLLADPTSSERGRRGGLLLAVGDLCVGEVAGDEGGVVRGYRGDEF